MQGDYRLKRGMLATAIGLWLGLALAGPGATADEPKRVLILDSFGRDLAPFNAMVPAIKDELGRQCPAPVVYYEASVATLRPGAAQVEEALVAYLRAQCAGRAPDLAVLIGRSAAAFWGRQRMALFPATPVVIGAMEQGGPQTVGLNTNDAAVALHCELPALIEVMLDVFPATTNIAVVLGNSPLERAYVARCREAWQPFNSRVRFDWLNELPHGEMLQRVAALPPHAAVGYGMLFVDGAGVSPEQVASLDRFCAEANAPVFGLFEEQLGHGIVGGRLMSIAGHGREVARLGARVLAGEPASRIPTPAPSSPPPVFDWRQLRRWGVVESRLPPESVVRFRPPTAWDQYRWYILGALAIILAQAATITGVLLQRGWCRRAETSAREVSGRLIGAQEDERRRIARDLHDDMNQRLALLSVELDLASHAPPESLVRRLQEMAEQVKELSTEVHRLSYQLHPAKLDQLGLVTAARTLCHELSAPSGLRIGFAHENVPRELPAEIALCLYRVLQETLGNAIRHSSATEARVDLRMNNRHIHLTVSDGGRGFDLAQARRDGGLGLLSIQERARMVGGLLTVQSEPGRGTRVELTVPFSRAAPGGVA